MSRRSWLTTVGGAGALAASTFAQPAQKSSERPPEGTKQVTPAEPAKQEKAKTPSSLETIFKDIALTDQHGVSFTPAEVFNGKPVLVIFGYNGCPRCGTIADTAAVIQQRLIAEKQDVPIMVVSVQPETDSKDGKPREYVVKYYQEGLRQYQSEELKDADKDRKEQGVEAFDAMAAKDDTAKKADQKARVFHIVFPPSAEKSKDLQRRVGESLKAAGSKRTFVIDPKDFSQHTWFATLFDNEGNTVEAYRMVDGKNEAPEIFTKTLAGTISGRVAEISKEKGK